jgi:hypothetical protein
MKTKMIYLAIFSVILSIAFFSSREVIKNSETPKNDVSVIYANTEQPSFINLENSEKKRKFHRLKNLAQSINKNLIDSNADPEYDKESQLNDLVEYLEEVSDDDAENVQWTDETKAAVAQRLSDDPEIELSKVKCTDIFCTVLISKPIESIMNWREVDEKLSDVTRGHTIMQATPNGDGTTTARLFFSAESTRLPI